MGPTPSPTPERKRGVGTYTSQKDHKHLEFINKLVEAQFSTDEILEIEFAYNCAKNAHDGVYRESGERYFEHVREVALLFIDARIQLIKEGKETVAHKAVDKRTIIEALNHDTVEDTDLWGGGGRPEAEQRDVVDRRLMFVLGVDCWKGIMALSKVKVAENEPNKSAENAKQDSAAQISIADPQTQYVKLGDRTHNASTLGATALGKRARVLKDTEANWMPIFERLEAREDEFGEVAKIVLPKLRAHLATVVEELGRAVAAEITETKKPKEPKEFDQIHADFLEKVRQKGFPSADVDLIDMAYDFGRYDRRLENNGHFGAARQMALDLIEKMRPAERDSRLVVAVLLQFSIENGALFGSDFVPGLSYERVAHLNLARIFGDQVSRMVTGGTPDQNLRLRQNQATLARFVNQVETAGDQAVLISMLKAVNALDPQRREIGTDQDSMLQEQVSAFYPAYRRLAHRGGGFSRLAVLMLGQIKDLYPDVDAELN